MKCYINLGLPNDAKCITDHVIMPGQVILWARDCADPGDWQDMMAVVWFALFE